MLPSLTEVFGWVVATAATIGAYAGSYRLASGQRTRRSLALFIASLACLLLQGGLLALNAEMLRQATPLEMKPRAMEYEWKNTPAEQVTERTRILAASHYVDLGRIVDYVALDGKRTPYIPTAENIQLREQLQNLRLTLTHQQDNIRMWQYFLVSCAVTALTLGLALGSRQRAER